MDNSVRYKFKM